MSRTLKTLAEQLQTAQSERHYAQIIADHIESLLTPVNEQAEQSRRDVIKRMGGETE